MIRLVLLGFIVISAGITAKTVVKLSDNGASTNLDPAQANTVYDSLILHNIYDKLFTYKYLERPYKLKPQIAKAMPKISKDGLVYTFKIKEGVRYVDNICFPGGKGREVVAGDLVYGLKRHFDKKNRSRNAWLWRDRIVGLDEWGKKGADWSKKVEGLQALDRYTIQIKLNTPYPQLLYTLAMVPAAFIPREAVKKYGREFSVKPVGSGPYKLKSYNTKKAVLVRNTGYRKETLNLKAEGYNKKKHGFTGIKVLDGKRIPIVDQIEVSFMKEQVPRWNSFTKGNEIQYATIPIELLDKVLSKKNPVKLKKSYASKYNMKVALEFGLVYSNFNMDDPRVGYHKDKVQNEKNKVLRCAIRKAFNWPERVKRFYYGIGQAFPGVIPPGVDGYDEKLARDAIKPDYSGAKAMLASAGWTPKKLPLLEYGGVSSVRTKQFFEQFRGWMRRIGYPKNKIKFKSYATFGDYSKAMKLRKVMFHGLGWSIDYPDSENVLGLWYGPNQSPGSNSANFDNKEYNALFKKASVLQPSSERTKIYQQLNKILIEECVTIAGFSRTGIYLWHKNVLMYPDRDVLGGGYFRYIGLK